MLDNGGCMKLCRDRTTYFENMKTAIASSLHLFTVKYLARQHRRGAESTV